MPTFSYTPSYATQVGYAPRVLEAKFGDGYSQRSVDGINVAPQKWSVAFDGFNDTDADSIVAFLKTQGGASSFDWTPPRGASAKYICREWTNVYVGFNNNNISAIFEQVFD